MHCDTFNVYSGCYGFILCYDSQLPPTLLINTPTYTRGTCSLLDNACMLVILICLHLHVIPVRVVTGPRENYHITAG